MTIDTASPSPWLVYQHPDQATPAAAAHYALLFLANRNLDEDLDADVGTVMSLLAANACQHGNPPVCTSVVITRDGVEVHVSDAGRITDFGPDRQGLSTVKQITGGHLKIQPRRVGDGKTVIALIPYSKEHSLVTTTTASTSAVERIRQAADYVLHCPAELHVPLMAEVFGTLAALAGLYEPVSPGRLADQLDIAIANTIGRHLKPGDTIRVNTNDYGTLTGPVETIRESVYGTTIQVRRPDGKLFTQSARFVEIPR